MRNIQIAALVIVSFTSELSAQTPELNVESFDLVWNTINTRFYDSDFNGIDWRASKEMYRPSVVNLAETDSFYWYVNLMLFELGVSHTGVVPTDDPTQLGEATVFGEGTVGIDVRYIEDGLYIVAVAQESSAAGAGLKAGFRILSLDGKSIEKIARESERFPTPPFTDRNRLYNALGKIYWKLYGRVGESLSVRYIDGDAQEHLATLMKKSRGERRVFDPGMPPTYVSLHVEKLEGDIGYIRFSSFHPALLDELMDSLDAFAGSKGIIIDLRGNPGGAFGVRAQLASRFIQERTLIWHYRGRNGIDDIYIDPIEPTITAHLVILVDEMSASSSEEFSGGLQAIGRAAVIGNQTPGRDVVMDIMVLPNDSYFVFPVAETMTSKGRVIEKNGVTPDIVVEHDIGRLRAGEDRQLNAAIRFIKRAE